MTTVRKIITLLILILAHSLSGFGQTDFRKGFIIKSPNDTLRGYLNFREGTKVFKECDFRLDLQQAITTYGPDQIVGYGFDNDRFFISREVKLQEKTETVFLEVLVEGLARLYKHDQKYFIEKDTSGLLPLINEVKETYINERRVFKNTNQHIATLNMLLFDCAEVRSELQKIRLLERPLTELVKDYNVCKGGTAKIYKEKKPWSKATFGIAGGFNISNVSFNPRFGHDHLLNGTFERSKSLTVGFAFDILSPRVTERFSLTGNILYSVNSFYKFSESPMHGIRDYVTLNVNQLQLPLGFKYTFPVKKVSPFLQLGSTYIVHTKSSSTWIREVFGGNVVTTTEDEALEISKYQLGFWGGIGLTKPISKKIDTSFELRYLVTNGPSELFKQLPSRMKSLQFLIAIKIK